MLIIPIPLSQILAYAERKPDLYQVATWPPDECQSGWSVAHEDWVAIIRREDDVWYSFVRDEEGNDAMLDMGETMGWISSDPTGVPNE